MPNKISHFWQELKRRNVVRVITVYAASAFVVLELVDILAPSLGLPDWTLNLVLILLVVGFIIAVIVSWIYDVHPVGGIVKTEPTHQVQSEDMPPSSNRWKIASYISFVVIVGLIALNIFGGKNRVRIDESLAKSIAVLPFHNLSGDNDQEYICLGLTDEIISNLFKIASFDEVRSLTSVLQFQGSEKSIKDIAQELQVNYILEGSYKRMGDELKITAQLIEPGSDKYIWLQDYELHYGNVPGIPGEVALQIADHLNLFLLDQEKQHIGQIPTNNAEAYDLYLKGIHSSGISEEQDIQDILDLYSHAIEKDPNFALPYIGMAWEIFTSSFDAAPPVETYPLTLEYVQRALELDSTLAEGYYMLGVINTYYYWNFVKAEKYFQKAISLKPRLADAHREYAVLLILSDRKMEAIIEAQEAKKCDPTSSWLKTLEGFSYYFDRQYDRAIELLNKVILEDPAYNMAYWYLSAALRAKNLCEGAIGMYEKMGFDDLSNAYLLANIGLTYYECGDKYTAAELFNLLEDRADVEYVSPTSLYLIHNAKGEHELAYACFEKAINQRDFWLLWVNVSPLDRDRFPEEPRYDNLLRLSGLKE